MGVRNGLGTCSIDSEPPIVADAMVDKEEWELLCPEEMEEAVDVLVGEVDWLDEVHGARMYSCMFCIDRSHHTHCTPTPS